MNTKDEFMRKTAVVLFGAFICCLLWGSAFPCVKIGYQMIQITSGDFATQILYAGYRFTIAGLLVILFGSLGKKKLLIPQKRSWGKILNLGMFQTVGQYIFFYIGLAHTSGVKSSIIIGTNAFVAILIASLIFHQEKLTVRKVVGCVIGFAGVALITLNGNGIDMNMSFTGEGFMFLSTVAYAFSSVYFKRYAKEEDSFVLSGYQFLLGGIILSAVGYLAGGRIDTFDMESAAMLLYLSFVAAAAYTLWGVLLKYNPISRVAVYGCMNPVIGVILSILLLHEKDQASGLRSALALILVSIGIYVVNGINEKWRIEDERIGNIEKG